jgi:hypothetical protein
MAFSDFSVQTAKSFSLEEVRFVDLLLKTSVGAAIGVAATGSLIVGMACGALSYTVTTEKAKSEWKIANAVRSSFSTDWLRDIRNSAATFQAMKSTAIFIEGLDDDKIAKRFLLVLAKTVGIALAVSIASPKFAFMSALVAYHYFAYSEQHSVPSKIGITLQ